MENHLFLLVILLVLLVGVGSGVFVCIRSILSTLRLRKKGILIEATVTGLVKEINLAGIVTNYRVLAEWQDPRTHSVHRFESAPGNWHAKENYGMNSQVKVLIDPTNPQQYEMVLQCDEYASQRGPF